MARVIVITSGKGGVGKTTVTALLGARLAELGERVVALDLDFGLNNLDVALGVEGKIVYDIADVVEGRCRARQALVESQIKNLFVLPSTHTLNRDVTGQNVKLLVEGLKKAFNYVLLDCAAGIELSFHRAISAADEVILVVSPTLYSLRDADKVLAVLKSYQLDKVAVLVNKVRGDLAVRGKQLTPYEIEAALKIPLIGAIPDDNGILLQEGAALCSFSRSGVAFSYLAQSVKNKKYKVYDCLKKYQSFFARRRVK